MCVCVCVCMCIHIYIYIYIYNIYIYVFLTESIMVDAKIHYNLKNNIVLSIWKFALIYYLFQSKFWQNLMMFM